MGDLSQEFFSLDLGKLESSIMTIPFHKQIGLDEEEMEPDFLESVLNKCKIVPNSEKVEMELSNKMLSLLGSGKSSCDNKESGQDKQKSSHTKEEVKHNDNKVPTSSSPLEQRQKKQRTRTTETNRTEEECDDLKFIEELGKKESESEAMTEEVVSTSDNPQPVQIDKSEEKNLEDWLDDFLDD